MMGNMLIIANAISLLINYRRKTTKRQVWIRNNEIVLLTAYKKGQHMSVISEKESQYVTAKHLAYVTH